MDLIREILPLLLLHLFWWTSLVDATIYAYNSKNESFAFDDMEASFGPGVNSEGIMGVLLRAEPYDACSSIKPPPVEPNLDSNVTIFSFALIRRGTCDFALKVFNAQNAGYRAAIVHNIGSDSLVRMSSGLPSIVNEIYTPSVFVGETTGIRLNESFLYNSGGSPYIQLYEGQFNPLDYYLVPFVIVIAVCFVSLLCFLLIKCLRDRRRARRGRLSLQRLKKLPVKKFDKGDEYDVCAICLDDYEEGDSLRILPCDHAYHCKCVDPWLTSSKRICPLCKRRVLSDDESSSSDDGGDTTDDERTPLTPSSAAASPNAPMYATGYGSRNPFLGRRQANRRVSDSSDTTTSTDVSDIEHESAPPSRRAPPRKTVTISLTNELPQTSGYQTQQLSSVTSPEVEIVNPLMSPADPDAYLDSAEAMMAGPSRVSESSIAVLSDVESISRASTPGPHSYSSHDFHSVDESTTEGQPPENLQSSECVVHDDQDDIVVIAQGSKSTLQGNDSEV